MVKDVALILEGGGMRAAYTAGVLDAFIEQNITFGHVYGVSAGAGHACSFLSKQKERAMRIVRNYINDDRYCGWKTWIKTGNYFGAKFIYETIPNELDCFDYKTANENPCKLTAVTTRLDNGMAEYVEIKDFREDMPYIRASASLPLLSRIVKTERGELLDGGIADSIPMKRAIEDGYEKCVVILTRDATYRKSPLKGQTIFELSYRKYPHFVNAAKNRYEMYNAQVREVEMHQKMGRAYLFRPIEKVEIGRIEKSKDKLMSLYQVGLEDGRQQIGALKEFLMD